MKMLRLLEKGLGAIKSVVFRRAAETKCSRKKGARNKK